MTSNGHTRKGRRCFFRVFGTGEMERTGKKVRDEASIEPTNGVRFTWTGFDRHL